MARGSCLCGNVVYETHATPKDPWACHCGQCRKQSGHYWASLSVKTSELAVSGEVKWFSSSDKAERGFCPACGSALFWRPLNGDTISFSMGSIEGPSGRHLERHIFTADKGDYYDIADGVKQE